MGSAKLLLVTLVALPAVVQFARADGELKKVTSIPLEAAAHEVKVVGNRAYVGNDHGIEVFDLSNPASPKKLGAVKTGQQTLMIAVKDDHAFLACNRGGTKIVSLTTMKEVADVKAGGWGVAVKDNVLYTTSWGGALAWYDIADRSAPKLLKNFELPCWRPPSYAIKPATEAEEAELLKRLTAQDNKQSSSYLLSCAIVGQHLFITEWRFGRLYAFDISDAVNPKFAGSHFIAFSHRVDGHGDWVFVHGVNREVTAGVYSLKMSALSPTKATLYDTLKLDNPNNCKEAGYLKLPVSKHGGLCVTPTGKYVLCAGGGKLHVVDVATPLEMKVLATAEDKIGAKEPYPIGLATHGDYIYTAPGNANLLVYEFPGLSKK